MTPPGFYPDKPGLTIHPIGLNAIKGEWLIQPKPDGWRCLVLIGGPDDVRYISRELRPLGVSQALRDRWDRVLAEKFGPDSLLDGEWCQRRPSARIERLWIIDLLAVGGYSTRMLAAGERRAMLERTVGQDHELLLPSQLTATQLEREGFWQQVCPGGARHEPAYEGVVLKDPDSRYIGSARQCAANPRWIRCKWRGGASGQSECERRGRLKLDESQGRGGREERVSETSRDGRDRTRKAAPASGPPLHDMPPSLRPDARHGSDRVH